MKYLKIYESFSKRSVEDFIKEKNIQNDITELYASNNRIESLKGIENLTNLRRINCFNNKIESLKGIENLIKLDILYCYNNRIESLKPLENLINLIILDCWGNEIEFLDPLKNLTNLTEIWCDDNPIKYPIELPNNLNINKVYGGELVNKFKTYELQKEFLEKFPEKINALKPIGFHEKIKEEFSDLIEGSDFGFFG